MKKQYKSQSVYEAAIQRIEWTYDNFEQVYLSFSGGKDSGVMLNLVLEVARKRNALPLKVLFIDLEAQYKATIDYVQSVMNSPEIDPCWLCLPIHLRNSVSQYQPHWMCWDPDKKDIWVREMPDNAISDPDYFPFFRKGMEFEELAPEFGKWIAGDKKTACFVGIRTDESLNRFRSIARQDKAMYKGQKYTTGISENLYNVYPIYDWRTDDIWVANGKFKWQYNRLYDLMYKAGLTVHQMRICQPYGDDQRKGLWLYKIIEPETWSKIVARVEGANFGNRYTQTNTKALAYNTFILPQGHTYESYSKYLLSTMPPYLRDHYMAKINKFLAYWQAHGIECIPDKDDPKLEAARKVPSWRRIAKVLLKNDYWCKGLSFSQTKKEMEKQHELILKYQDL